MPDKGYRVGKDQSGLTQREREVLSLIRNGITTLNRIGEVLGMTKQRASQIRHSLIEKGHVEQDEDGSLRVKEGA